MNRYTGIVVLRLHLALLCASLCVLSCALPTVGTAEAATEAPHVVGTWTDSVACAQDPSQTYALYLPSDFDANEKNPALLVFDPRGRSRMAGELFHRAAEEFGWVVLSSNDTRSDTSWDPNAKALQALWPEVQTRYGIDRQRIYAAGFSGGVIVAWYLAQFADRPTLAGILSAGGRPADEIPTQQIAFAHFGTAGVFDFNYAPMKVLDAIALRAGADHQLRFFPGRHEWMPEPLAYEGIEWMEVLAMRDGLRAADAAIRDRAYQRLWQRADSLLQGGQELESLRCLRVLRTSFRGLRDLRALDKRLSQLEASPTVRQQQQIELQTDRWYDERQQEMIPVLAPLEAGTNTRTWQELVGDLRVEDLQRRAREGTLQAEAAQRLLEWIFTRTSFYIWRELLARGATAQAAVSLRIAATIHPQLPYVWYNLACAHAQADALDAANEALRRAIDAGFRNLAHLEADRDLAALRGTAGYQQCVATLRSR